VGSEVETADAAARTPPGPPAPRRAPARARRWRWLVPVVCLLAGFGFAVSARASHGTDLRPPGNANLADLVRSAEQQVQAENATLRALQRQVSAATSAAGAGNAAVAAEQAKSAPLRAPAGLTAVQGPGITVILNDAPSSAATAGVNPNVLVVHQQDLQAVVNALWAGGADAMTISGQRVIATSAVRCVGNTLLLNGNVYSPPFRVAAIGPYRTMSAALGSSPDVGEFEQAASYYGLGYTVEASDRLTLPAYSATIGLAYARVAPR
jgi:uncharacterized protein YlxW (UPF0749 family)